MIIAISIFAAGVIGTMVWGLVNGLTRKGFRVPGWDLRVSREVYSPEAMAEFLDLWVRCWEVRCGRAGLEKVRAALNGVDLEWSDLVLDVRGVLASGVTDYRNKVRVWSGPGVPLRKTALSHELVHVVLWALQGDPDADHMGNKYHGWTEKHELVINDMRYAARGHDDGRLV